MANRHMERCSTLLIIREIKIKATSGITPIKTANHQNRQERSVGEDVAKRDALCMLGGNLNACSHYENSTEILKKLEVEPPYNSAIPLLGIHPKEIK